MKTLTSNTLRLEAFLCCNQTVVQQPHKREKLNPDRRHQQSGFLGNCNYAKDFSFLTST